MAGTYRQRIEDLIHALEARPDLAVDHAELGAPATEQEIATARTYAAYRLPRGVEEFYREVNGFHLKWEFQGSVPHGQERDRGALHLLPVERIFGSWKDVIWFDDFAGGERFRAIKPFDFFQPEVCMAFSQEADAAPQDEVYVHYVGEDLCATHYSFSEYVDRLIAARGYLYWQLTICPDTQTTAQVRQFKARMPILFPGVSLTAFVPHTTGT